MNDAFVIHNTFFAFQYDHAILLRTQPDARVYRNSILATLRGLRNMFLVERCLWLPVFLLLGVVSSSVFPSSPPHHPPRNGALDAAAHDFRRSPAVTTQDRSDPPSCPGLRTGKIKGRDMTSDECNTGSSIIADHNLAFGFSTNNTDVGWRECLSHYPAEK